MNIRHLGYACINETLSSQKPRITTSRTMRRQNFDKDALDNVALLALQNAEDLMKILEWNLENSIYFFRLSSNILPWKNLWQMDELPNGDNIRIALSRAGEFARANGMRLSLHPSHFNKLCSSSSDIVNATIRELEDHSELMDLLGMPKTFESPINIHVGGAYGNREATASVFIQNWYLLSDSLKSRLTLENDDKDSLYKTEHLYELIHKEISIPLVFDFYHYRCNCVDALSEEESAQMAYSTWPKGVIPKFHWSESLRLEKGDNSLGKTAHSILCHGPLPEISLPGMVDLMLESKGKEASIFTIRRSMNGTSI